jgi:hypothetical protein
VRRALDADIPSDSDDDRLDVSDDSDADPDYKEPVGPGEAESSDEGEDDDLPDVNEPVPLPSTASQGPSLPINAPAGSSNCSARPAKKQRAEWNWADDDIPFKDSPVHEFTIKG